MESSGKKNKNNVAHGGAVFALADQAFGIAANCGGTDCVAVSVHIQYIAPATGSLVAVAHRVADNGIHSLFRVVVCQEDRIIADFDGVAIRVSQQSQQ
jgi:acyl-CoA thioesterase